MPDEILLEENEIENSVPETNEENLLEGQENSTDIEDATSSQEELTENTDESLDGDSVSGNSIDSLVQQNSELLGMLMSQGEEESIVMYESLEDFKSSEMLVDRYQYEILSKLEFIQ